MSVTNPMVEERRVKLKRISEWAIKTKPMRREIIDHCMKEYGMAKRTAKEYADVIISMLGEYHGKL